MTCEPALVAHTPSYLEFLFAFPGSFTPGSNQCLHWYKISSAWQVSFLDNFILKYFDGRGERGYYIHAILAKNFGTLNWFCNSTQQLYPTFLNNFMEGGWGTWSCFSHNRAFLRKSVDFRGMFQAVLAIIVWSISLRPSHITSPSIFSFYSKENHLCALKRHLITNWLSKNGGSKPVPTIRWSKTWQFVLFLSSKHDSVEFPA